MIKNIAIVGGGTAGWLTANHLGQVLLEQGVSITLIESPNIPTIGVGEGTVPSMRQSLKKFGIRESDFIRECDVTFKQSIKFVNWLDKKKHGENYYHHLFDSPVLFGDELTAGWLGSEQNESYADYVSKQTFCCDKMLAPKTITTPEYIGINGYAYHFDAKKFALFLSKHAIKHFAIQHLLADISDIKVDCDGYITHLETADNESIAFDFVIDCSGFSAAIIGDKLGVEFLDRSDLLLTDTALTLQVPTCSSDAIPPYTIATAHQAGWIWDIALTQRRGIGLVYSSKHMSDEQAHKKLHHYLGNQFTDLVPRKIPMKVGRRKLFWHKNCVAIGLSQGFVEPLEATAILLADFSASLLAKRFPRTHADISLLNDAYNKKVSYVWDQTFDFIKMHYCISDRKDSAFWLENKAPDSQSEKLQNNLARWQRFSPIREDFDSKFDLFDFDNYLYVLNGMKLGDNKLKQTPVLMKKISEQKKRQQYRVKQLLSELPDHRELINKIKEFGLQKQ